ncbi:sporulation protein YtxC [Gottschalkia acidurici 9a]|uniref:Sporulation protein YtxC n=1 Tax=Gottschalkia acidurici (strain ATCC 7906 / DSM 604 / BCRC 14475 / CIP 104303 / KCTC 5404 / NCIMB 10678 / 9a) TaxID=1128398 RepID=K0AZ13_GOTA9|nr:putative sporulation protein YtxC [Gottschalkia acidurici]AFS77920.1 sporulation protein YtxC [Gottschalkia acidurici 9a]
MNEISITTTYNVDTICDILDKKLSFLKKEGLYIDYYVDKLDAFSTIKCKVDKDRSTLLNYYDTLKIYISNGILDIIFNIYILDIIEETIIDRFYPLNKSDMEFVKDRVKEDLYNQEYIGISNSFYRQNIRNKILMKIMNYFDEDTNINIDGFIDFRLGFYKDHLENIIQRKLEELAIEKEYREFIEILQYFIEIQEPKVDLINIMIEDEKYKLIDNNNNVISNDYLEEIASELSDIDITYDDLLISSLITIAPKEVIIHTDKEQSEREVVNIIKSVFEDKVTICKTSK